MKTFITTSDDVKAMVKAMKVAGLNIEKTRTTRKVEINGKTIFWAMKGSKNVRGTWMVRHNKNLFA
jgi:5-enolpyruvylshikimate-3-phosphate synthase